MFIIFFCSIIFGRFHDFLQTFVEVFGITVFWVKSQSNCWEETEIPRASLVGRMVHVVVLCWVKIGQMSLAFRRDFVKNQDVFRWAKVSNHSHLEATAPPATWLGLWSERDDGHNLCRGRSNWDIATLSGWWFQIYFYLQRFL